MKNTKIIVKTKSKSYPIYFGDRILENEWAILVKNLYNFGTLSMLNFDGLLVPNLWMPPFYAYFIYLHTLIFGIDENIASYVITTQVIISSFTSIIFYKIISKFFSSKTSFTILACKHYFNSALISFGSMPYSSNNAFQSSLLFVFSNKSISSSL